MSSSPIGHATLEEVVLTRQGWLRGHRTADAVTFLGVPYAASPSGERRMKPPQPPEKWSGIRSALSYGPTAPKGAYPDRYRVMFPEMEIEGPDFLNLNVWAPVSGRNCPVLLWIHGGSFTNGSGSLGEYDGSAFARDGVVCVTINYRLAAEGFLHFADGTANLGMLDQVAALQWVHDNIAAFGGDPDRVTIAGESAGAVSVLTLMAMPAAQGLFRQAIAQSGYVGDLLTPELGHYMAVKLAERLDVTPTRSSVTSASPADVVVAASDLAADVELGTNLDGWLPLPRGATAFTPIVDPATLPVHPCDALTSGATRQVKLLVGWNRDEARLEFVTEGQVAEVNVDSVEQMAAELGLPCRAVELYRRNRPGAQPGDVLAALFTDWAFGISAIRVAERRIRGSSLDTWVYRFDHPAPGDNFGLGACHGVEIPYVFDCIGRDDMGHRVGSSPSQRAADTAHGVWVDFVRSGDPGWPRYDVGLRIVGLLGESVALASDPSGDERRLWDGIR